MVPFSVYTLPVAISTQHAGGAIISLGYAIGIPAASFAGAYCAVKFMEKHPEATDKIFQATNEILAIPRIWKEAGEEVRNESVIEQRSMLDIWRDAGESVAKRENHNGQAW